LTKMPGWIVWRAALAVLVAAPALAEVTVELGSATARPGETTEIAAILRTDAGEEVAAVQLDLTYDPDEAAIAMRGDGRPDCDVPTAIDKGASGFGYRPSTCDPLNRECRRVRGVIVAADNSNPIPSGAVLHRCRLSVPFDARPGSRTIRVRRAMYAQPDGRERDAAAIDGVITIAGAPLDTPTPSPTIAPSSTPTRSGSGGGGCTLTPPANSGGARLPWLFGLLLALLFGRRAHFPNPLLSKRALHANAKRARDGRPPSSRKRERQGVSSSLRLLLALSAIAMMSSSSIAEAAVRLEVGTATGFPGDSVTISVRLTTDAGEEVAGTQNDLRFDPAVVAVAAREDGKPDCSVNPDINKLATAFGFRPAGCMPELRECSAVRTIVLAFDNVDPIAGGSILYTCRMEIAADAAPGEYSLANTRAGYAPPPGGDRPAVGGEGLVVVGVAPTSTSAPTETPVPTHTMSTPNPTVAANDPGDTNCDGRIDREDHHAVMAMLFTRTATCNADCNRDGEVSGADLVCVTRRRLIQSDPGGSLRSRLRLARRAPALRKGR
jgi:hypothetical protein